jgi:ankyrin repeat protein
LAASRGSVEAVKELLTSPKTLPDAKNNLKKTPAHLAATKGHLL